jgi:nucleoside-diphosphate-sugar epimerase
MNKLIIGCGYVGQRLASYWHDRGAHVFAVTRRSERAEEFRRRGWTPLIFDITNPGTIDPIPTFEVVVFAVGFDRASGLALRAVYVDGLANVLAKLAPPGRFIYVSSTSVYGQTRGEEVDELASTKPEEASGQVVLAAEQTLLRLHPQAVVLRFGGIYGPGRLLRELAVRTGEAIPADPNRWLNLIQVDDGVGAILAAEERGLPGVVYNVVDDRPVERHLFFEKLAELIGAPRPRFVPPGRNGIQAPHERANRRLLNRKMKTELGVKLSFPSYLEGLPAAVIAIEAGGASQGPG